MSEFLRWCFVVLCVAAVGSIGTVLADGFRRARRLRRMKLSAARAAGTEDRNAKGSGAMADHGTGVDACGVSTEKHTGAAASVGERSRGPGVNPGKKGGAS
jgi:hypothetical protein